MANAVQPVRKQSDSKARLRLWLRLLRSTRKLESEMRERLRIEFNTTLPRFDVMAALYRKPKGMMMSELSRYLVVSNGNITGIIDRLVDDGLVMRAQRQGDRRTSIVCLTGKGLEDFKVMARTHEVWVNKLFAGISAAEVSDLTGILENIEPERENQ